MLMRREYLFVYSCLLPNNIRDYIDCQMNCEDIAMSLMVAGLTGKPHMAVNILSLDYGTTSGISSRKGHLNNRSKCLSDLIKLFDINPLQDQMEMIQMAFEL